MATLKGLIRSDNVRAESEMVDENPNMAAYMPAGSYHYRVTLKRKGRQLTVPFSMGPALDHEPTAEEVLACMLSDASSADRSFEEWCRDYGFDEDSRKAERTYQAIQRQTKQLRQFLQTEEILKVYLEAEQ